MRIATQVISLGLALAALASAQTALTCVANAGVPPTVRSSGKTELVGDITINCTGGTPTPANMPVPLYTITVQAQSFLQSLDSSGGYSIAPVNITSRQLASDGSSEALVLLDEPHSATNPNVPLLVCGDTSAPTTAGVCAITGTGSGLNTYNGTANRPNVFQGKLVAADTLQWTGVPFDPPGQSTRILRITNVRLNASQAPLSTRLVPTELLLTPTLTSPTVNIALPGGVTQAPGAQVVAFLQKGMLASTNTPVSAVSLPQCQSSNPTLATNPASSPATYSFWVRVMEGFQSSFKRKNVATNGPSATTAPAGGDQNQNVTTAFYTAFTESAFENLGPIHDPVPNPPPTYANGGYVASSTPAFPANLIGAGVADNGMRVAVMFNSIPTGVLLFVPTSIRLTNQLNANLTGEAVLVSTDVNGAGAFNPAAGNGGSIGNFGPNVTGLAPVGVFGGVGVAVYEIMYADGFSPDEFSIPVALSYAAGVPPTGVTATVTVSPAPLPSGSDTAGALPPIPRFNSANVESLIAQPLFVFKACGTSTSSITLAASARTFTPADTVTYTAAITPVPAAAGGQVTFSVDQATIGTATLATDGTAKLSFSVTHVGAHDITATYVTPAPENQAISAILQVLVTRSLITAVTNTATQSAPAGTAFIPLAAQVVDSTGAPRSGASVVFTAPASGASGTFSNGTNTIAVTTNSSGIATAPFTANSTLGGYLVTAVLDANSSATFSLTNAAIPASITVGNSPQSARVNTAFFPLTVQVKDGSGTPAPGITVTYNAPTSGPGGNLTTAQIQTDATGYAALPFTANGIAGGPYNVTATVAGLTPVTFSLTNLAGPPVIATHPSSLSVPANSIVSFFSSATDFPAPALKWQVSTNGGGTFTDIAGATLNTLTLSGVSVANNGNQYRAVFTNSTGSTNSNAATLTVTVATPVITWANPADIFFGTPLSGTQLNAGSSAAGTFVYSPVAGTVLPPGNLQMLTVVFTPTDTANYTTASKTVSINVLPVTPSVLSLTPITSNGTSQSFAVQFSHPSGFASLSVTNVLINSALDGRKACYIAYVQQTNTIYLVNDNGDAGGPFAGSLVLNGGSGTAANGQCMITGTGSSAVGSGTALTLTLNIAFTTGFVGGKVIYGAARDVAAGNSGWQITGVHGVPFVQSPFPTPVSVSPASGSGSAATLTFLYQDATVASNFQTVWALINGPLDGRGACYVAYYRPGNLLYLIPENGDGTQATSIVLTGTNSLSNSQCTVSLGSPLPPTAASILPLVLNIIFKSGFTGQKVVWMAGQTLAGQTSPWQPMGVWRVP